MFKQNFDADIYYINYIFLKGYLKLYSVLNFLVLAIFENAERIIFIENKSLIMYKIMQFWY